MKFLKAEPVEFFVSVSGYLVFKNYTITILLTPEQSKVLQKQLQANQRKSQRPFLEAGQSELTFSY
jgi:hypothetical protein